jgi:hypothetical protein
MAQQTLEPVRYSSGPYRVVNYTEAASQTYTQGAAVYLVAGKVTECADDATVILGFAMQDASGTTDAIAPVVLAQDGTCFRANAYHAAVGSSAAAVTMLDDKWGLEELNGRFHVDVGQAGADSVQIVKFISDIGDTYPFCEFVVLPEAQQLGAAAT